MNAEVPEEDYKQETNEIARRAMKRNGARPGAGSGTESNFVTCFLAASMAIAGSKLKVVGEGGASRRRELDGR